MVKYKNYLITIYIIRELATVWYFYNVIIIIKIWRVVQGCNLITNSRTAKWWEIEQGSVRLSTTRASGRGYQRHYGAYVKYRPSIAGKRSYSLQFNSLVLRFQIFMNVERSDGHRIKAVTVWQMAIGVTGNVCHRRKWLTEIDFGNTVYHSRFLVVAAWFGKGCGCS